MNSSWSVYLKMMKFASFCILLILFTKRSVAEDMELQNVTEYDKETTLVRNIKAGAFYDDDNKDIHLNITWENPPEAKGPGWHITQSLQYEDSNEYCDRGDSLQETDTSPDTTSVILQKEHYPNCTYKVQIVGELPFGVQAPHVIYTIPECVDNKCICHFLLEHPVSPDIIVKQKTDKIRILWKIPEITTMSNVSTISFKVYQSAGIREKAFLTRNITSWCATRQCHEDVHIPGMTIGTLYTVESWYADASNCLSEPAHVSFHALDVAESQLAFQVMISLMFVIMFVCVLWLIWKRKCYCLRGVRTSSPSHLKRIDIAGTNRCSKRVSFSFPMQYNNLYVRKESKDNALDEYEVSYTQLQVGPQIGDGAFGQVFRARLPPYIIVAVKTLKQNASSEELEDFLLEIAMLKQIGRHPNIVTLLGCCTVRQPYCMVMEYIPCGDLLRYLHAMRTYYERDNKRFIFDHNDHCSNDSSKEDMDAVFDDSLKAPPSIPFNRLPSITETVYTELNSPGALQCVLEPRELQNFAIQIARGMRHLEHKQIVHRDLAARNVLIDENKTLKISDFGLSRTGVYVNSKQKKVPLRWMSIEAIRDNLYTSKSDVWAFGIVLWEIGTLGGFPYSNVRDTEILRFLLSGRRLEKPENCTAELYTLMLRSWSSTEGQRPSFTELLEDLEAISSKHRVYVDFGQLNPVYIFPPKSQLCTDVSDSSSDNQKPRTCE